jgi:capsular exopolysaccharide synthesis family protein
MNTSSPNNIDIKSYIYKIIAYWKLFIITIIISFIVARFVNGYQQEKYSISTIISVKEENNPLFSTGTNIAFNWGGSSDLVQTVKVVLNSRTHNEKVVDSLNFFINYLKEGIYRLEDVYGQIPFRIELDKTKPQLYNKLIEIKVIGPDKVRLTSDFNKLEPSSLITYEMDSISYYSSNEPSFSHEVTINNTLRLPYLNFKIAANAPLTVGESYYIRFNNFDSTVGVYKGVGVGTVTNDASVLRLSMRGPNKNRMVDFLNVSVAILKEDKKNQKVAYAINTKKYIQKLFNQVSDTLAKNERNLGIYKQKNNIYNLSSEGSQIYSETLELNKEKIDIVERLNYLRELEIYIKTHQDMDQNIPVPALINIQDSKIRELIGVIIELSTKRKMLRIRVTEEYPGLKIINTEIEVTKSKLFENILTLRRIYNSRLNELKSRLENYRFKQEMLPTKEQKLLKFERSSQIYEANYLYLKQKDYEAGTAIAANVSDIKIIDSAKDLGGGPFYPNKGFNLLVALMLGAVVPLFYIILKELLDNKIHTVEDINQNYSIPVLGVVGRNLRKTNLIAFERPKSSVAESFRSIRSNIKFLFKSNSNNDDGLGKTLLLTSSVSGEGKTMVAINLATVFALGGKKTVLVGLDLRKPKIYDDFDMPNEIGVVNYLINQKTIDEIIFSSKIPNLDVILSGPIPPNPSELLLNQNTDNLINKLKERYDYVIIDTAPVGLVSDALELFKYSDAIIYVIRQNYSEKGMMNMIDNKYINKEVTNISYILNDFTVANKYGYDYGYGYGYGYGTYAYGYHDNEEHQTLLKKFINLFKPRDKE